MGLSELIREFFIGDLSKSVFALSSEVRTMSQAINDRLDAIEADIAKEKAEVVAAIEALQAEVKQGQMDETAVVSRLDGIKSAVEGIYTPPDVQPTPVV